MISCKDYCQQEKQRLKTIAIPNCQLDIFQIGDNPASNAYIKGKIKDCAEVGIISNLHKYPESITQDQLVDEIKKVSRSGTNGIILQLPVPKHIDPKAALKNNILPEQDVDGFIYNRYIPCTPKGILDWLEYNNISIEGKNVVIIGRSEIVGKPLAKEMLNRNATVTICHSYTNKDDVYKFADFADIIIVAVGKPYWFDASKVNCPLIIDVGINRTPEGKLCGDVKPGVQNYVTPVPGGVGLLTRLALLNNVLT